MRLDSAARRLPFFYGWVVVGVAMVASFVGAGANNISMGVVLKPMSEDLGWSRATTTGAITAGTVAGGFMAPFLGRLADRFGPRLLLPAGGLIVGASLWACAFVTVPWQFYVAYLPARAFGQTLLQGVVPMTAVANWFLRWRPRAMGLVAMSIPLGSAVLTLLFQAILMLSGWRDVFAVLALLSFTLVVVPGLLLLRRQPEDLGLLPDGATPLVGNRPAGRLARPPVVERPSWTFRGAVRTPALWLLAASLTFSTLATGSVGFHLVAYLTDVGVVPVLAAGALSTFALAGAVANVMWAVLAERFPPRWLLLVACVASAAGMMLLLQVRAPALAFVFAALFGLTARGLDGLGQIVIAHYYGRQAFGAISGIVAPFQMGALGLGPFIAALAFDLTGGYEQVFQGLVLTYLVAAVLIFFARPPGAETEFRPAPLNSSG